MKSERLVSENARATCGGKTPATIMAGGGSVTCDAGNTLGDCEVTIVLQQSWLWFDGLQGIDAQHCMLCRSKVIADMQSANCSNKAATTATIRNVLLRTIS